MEKLLMDFRKAFATTIKVERIRQDVTQEELAAMADISRYFLCKLENAQKTASIETYLKIALALNLQLADLFCGNSLSDESSANLLLSGCSDFEKRVCFKAIEGILIGIREGQN